MTPFLARVIAQREAEQEAAILATAPKEVPHWEGRAPRLERPPGAPVLRRASGNTYGPTDLATCPCGAVRKTSESSTGLCRTCRTERRRAERRELGRKALHLMEDGGSFETIAQGLGLPGDVVRRAIREARAA